jgi:hypothetical protein
MLPVHWPVIIPWPFRGRQAPRGPWDPSCDRHGMDKNQPWPLARWFVAPRSIFFQMPGKLPCMVRVHTGLIEVHFRPLQAAIGVAVRSFLTQGASSCKDNILAFLQSRTSFPGAIRKAPSLQRPPQRHGRERGLMGLEEILPQLPHTATLARSMLGPDIRTNDGLEMHGSTLLGVPTRFRRVGLEGVSMVTILGHKSLARDFPNIQALGCAQCGIPGRDFLRVLPFLIKMEFEVHDQWFHGWSKVFPLQRHSSDLPVGVEHGAGCRYRSQSVHGEVESVEKFSYQVI